MGDSYAKLRGMQTPMPAGPRWYVISLRPRGQHKRLRDVVRSAGHDFIALSPLRIHWRDDMETLAALDVALVADIVVFTSPNAVAGARALTCIPDDSRVAAIGEGTAQALRRAGVLDVQRPVRMESEGLLDLPLLNDVHGRRIGLVTAPGGRDRLAPALRARGAAVLRADVYARETCGLPQSGLRAMRGGHGRLALALSSAEALDATVSQLAPQDLQLLRSARVLSASERLAEHARRLGFSDVVLAHGPRPRQLVDALARHDD